MIRKPWLLAAGALLIAAGIHLADRTARDTAVTAFLADPTRATSRIAERYGVTPAQCASHESEEFRSLGAALLTIETLATPRLEGHLRTIAAYLAGLAHISLDISIGPGRIKPSTARAALTNLSPPGAGRDERFSDLHLTQKLLQPCEALRVAAAIAEDISHKLGPPGATLDRGLVRQIAAVYNGQKGGAGPPEARLSAEIYVRLVYNIYQHFRFENLREARADARDRAGQ